MCSRGVSSCALKHIDVESQATRTKRPSCPVTPPNRVAELLTSPRFGRRPESIRGLVTKCCRRPLGIVPPISLLDDVIWSLTSGSVPVTSHSCVMPDYDTAGIMACVNLHTESPSRNGAMHLLVYCYWHCAAIRLATSFTHYIDLVITPRRVFIN